MSDTPRKWADTHNNELSALADELGNVPQKYIEKVGYALLDMISLERELAALEAKRREDVRKCVDMAYNRGLSTFAAEIRAAFSEVFNES